MYALAKVATVKSCMRKAWLLAASLFFTAVPGTAVAQQRVNIDGDVVQLVNQYRASKSLQALAVDGKLAQAAELNARAMAQQDSLSHTAGGSPATRIQQAGYTGQWLGENIYYGSGGFATAASAVQWWKNSPPHNASLLNSQANQIGVSVYRSQSGKTYFCLMVGHGSNSGSGGSGGAAVGLQPNHWHTMIHKNTGKLVASGGGVWFHVWSPIPSGHEPRYRYKFVPIPNRSGEYYVQHQNTGKYWFINSRDNDAKLTSASLSPSYDNRFAFRAINAGGDWYYLVHVHSGRYVCSGGGQWFHLWAPIPTSHQARYLFKLMPQ